MSGKALFIASLTGIIIAVGILFFVLKPPPRSPVSGEENSPSPLTSPEKSPCPEFHEGEITIGNTRLNVAIAATQEEKARGLSGCLELPVNSGMLFPFDSAKEVSHWMKNMVIPIDIVWIRNGSVVGIERNVPVPAPNTSPKDLPQYHSPGPVDSVLEIKAGGAEEYGITIGSPFSAPN